MAWTTPAHQDIGALITKTLWDNDQDNFSYLKGLSGAITIDAGVTISGNLNVDEIVCKDIAFDGGYHNPKNIREITIAWEEDDVTNNYQVDKRANGAGADVNEGGTGQIVIKIQDDAAGAAGMENRAAQSSALANAANASRNPYFRAEFAIDEVSANVVGYAGFFLGLRQTQGDASPLSAAENYAGIWYAQTVGGYWPATGDGSGNINNGTQQDWSADTRYVVEVIFTGSAVDIWVNGVRILNATANLPTGDLEWQLLFYSDGTGAGVANIDRMTAGKVILQESLS